MLPYPPAAVSPCRRNPLRAVHRTSPTLIQVYRTEYGKLHEDFFRGRDAAWWRRFAPAAVDNYNMRLLLGEGAYYAPIGEGCVCVRCGDGGGAGRFGVGWGGVGGGVLSRRKFPTEDVRRVAAGRRERAPGERQAHWLCARDTRRLCCLCG